MQAANPPLSLRERLTTQPPLMWISLAFLTGIVLASLIALPLWIWIILFVVSIFPPILLRAIANRAPSLSSFILPIALIPALLLGSARYQFSVPRFDAFHIAFYNDRDYDLLITGYLVEPPDYRDA
jgi:hypothetical protein